MNAQAKENKVVPFKRVRSSEVVSVDFTDIDSLRKAIRELVPKYNKRIVKRMGRTHSYDYSAFYIGRGVTRVVFRNVNVSVYAIRKMVEQLMQSHPYNYVVLGTDLHVYMRGDRRR